MKPKKPNFKLMWKIFRKIENDPSCWDQRNWHCGTSHCFAGHVTLDAISKNKEARDYAKKWTSGLEYASKEQFLYDKMYYAEKFLLQNKFNVEPSYDMTFALARRLLGLDAREMSELTDGDNSLKKIRSVIVKLEKKYARMT